MSAFIVSNVHIDLLVEAVYRYEVPLDEVVNCITPDSLGFVLWAENYRSVNYRYSENEFTPHYQHDSEAVKDVVRDAHYVYKQCCCYHYQSCETDDYEESVACKIIERLQEALRKSLGLREAEIRASPQWDENPWGIE